MLHTYDVTFSDGFRDGCYRSTVETCAGVMKLHNSEYFQRATRHDPNYHGTIISITQVD